MFNKFFKKEKKDYGIYQQIIKEKTNKILDVIDKERITEYEMIDILNNLQKNFQLALLDKINKNDK